MSVLVFCLLTLPVLSSVSAAAGPQWAGGFPKLSQKNALLQWSPVKGATAYKVYRSESKGRDYKLVATVKANRYIDKELPGGKSLYYVVAAVVGGAEGARSSEGMVETAKEKAFVQLKTPKLAGGILKDQPGGGASVAINWTGAQGTDIVGVNVYRSKTKGKDYAMVGSSQGDSFEDKDTKRGETYFYVVTAVDSQFNETKYSNEIRVVVPAPIVAPAPKARATAPVEEVKPTKMRAAKFLFSLPLEEDKIGALKDVQIGDYMDVKVDEAVGHIYVLSRYYEGILVFNMDGKFQFGIRKDGVNGTDSIYALDKIAVGQNGNLYVTGNSVPVFYIFDFNGKLLNAVTVDANKIPGRDPVKNVILHGVAVTDDGTVFVSDPGLGRIHAFDRDGNFLFSIKQDPKKDFTFNPASYMVVDKSGDIVFVDAGGSRVMVLDGSGKLKRVFGKKGQSAGEMNYPTGLAWGEKGELFIASGTSANIQAFTTAGKFLYALCNDKRSGPIDVTDMHGIEVDSKGRLYVAEKLRDRVSVFQLLEGTVDLVPKQ